MMSNQNNHTNENNQEITKDQPIETSIAKVSVVPNISVTSGFEQFLQQIPEQVAKSNELLKEYRENPDQFIDMHDEEEIDAVIKDMGSSTQYVGKVKDSIKGIRKLFNDTRDEAVKELNNRLEDASFNELEKADKDMTQLKKDFNADRQARRWEEIRATFQANISRYPLIGQLAPELADFSRFKIINSKLISGAKTRKVKESDHTFVNEVIFEWNTALEMINENEWGLSVQDQNQLLTLFKQNPSVELVTREGRQLKLNHDARVKQREEAEKARLKAERQRKEAQAKRDAEMKAMREREALAKQQRDKAAQKQAEQNRIELQKKQQEAMKQEADRQRKLEADYAAFGGQYQTIFKESFPHFIGYLFQNPNYHDLHTNTDTKANVIYDIMHQVDNDQSVVVKETARDSKKILDLVRYILDA